MNDQRQRRARLALADDVKGFGAVDVQRQARGARLELQRQRAHADQVGAVDTLEAFGDDRLDARQTHGLGRPVTRTALPVVGTGDDDQRLLRSEEHTSELQSLMRLAYAVFCLKKKQKS